MLARTALAARRVGAARVPVLRAYKGVVRPRAALRAEGWADATAGLARRGLATTDTPKEDPTAPQGEAAAQADAAGAGDAPAESEEVKQLKEQVAKLEAEAAEAKDRMLRALAETENVRQRSKREIESANTYANQKFAKSMLSVADNLTRGLEAVPAPMLEDVEGNETLVQLVKGLKMTEEEMFKVLESFGVVPFGKEGDGFDPQLHEVIYQVEDPERKPNTINMVMQRGYMYKDRVLRPAQVGTIKQQKKPQAKPQEA